MFRKFGTDPKGWALGILEKDRFGWSAEKGGVEIGKNSSLGEGGKKSRPLEWERGGGRCLQVLSIRHYNLESGEG